MNTAAPAPSAPPVPRPDREAIRGEILACGVTLCGFTAAAIPAPAQQALRTWLSAGHAGTMAWLGESADERADPRRHFPWARTAVCVALAYDRPEPRAGGVLPRLSRYAQGRSYHNVLGKALKRAGRVLRRHGARDVVARVDTGPVLERVLAAQAGLGWLGKNSMLLHPQWGSYLFLGVLFTDLELAADAPMTDHCGSCDACLRACPTDAFAAPGVLDARRCISYANIEHRGEDPDDAATLAGWLHGCDDCQEVCPFVRRARRDERWGHADFAPWPRWRELDLRELQVLNETTWDDLTRGSDVRRGGPERLARIAERLHAAGTATHAKRKEG